MEVKQIRKTGKWFKQCKRLLIVEKGGEDLSYLAEQLYSCMSKIIVLVHKDRVLGYMVIDRVSGDIKHLITDSRYGVSVGRILMGRWVEERKYINNIK